MAGEFGAFVNQKRKGRGAGGSDVLLRDLAEAIGISVSYLSDVLKGRLQFTRHEATGRYCKNSFSFSG